MNSSGTVDNSNLSLIYPDAQQFLIDETVAVLKRQKDPARVRQVVLVLKPRRMPLWGVETGFEEPALKAFQETSGKVLADVPLANNLVRFKNDLREDWTKFRCEIVKQWTLRLRDELKKIRPDMQLVLQLADGSVEARVCGFDAALYKDQENIRVVELPSGETRFPKWVGGDSAIETRAETMTHGVELSSDVAGFRSPWPGGMTASLVPNKEHILRPLIDTLIAQNPRTISLSTQSRATFGADFELREFVRAFRSLPHEPLEELPGAVPEVLKEKVKAYRVGKGAVKYIAVVNRTAEAQTATVTVSEGPGPVRDLVLSRDLNAAAGEKGVSFEAAVPAFGIRTYRIGK